MLRHLRGAGASSDPVRCVDQAYESADYREGVRAFLARRPSRFEGR